MSDVQAQLVVVIVAVVGLLTAAVRFFGPVIDAKAENAAKKEWAEIEAKLPANVQAAINQAALFGAQAAEQMALGQHIANAIDAKKNYAVQAADRWLKAQGYEVDLTTLGDAIETVVLQGLHLPPPNETPQTAQAGNHPANKAIQYTSDSSPTTNPTLANTQQIPAPAVG